jgi:hypothetical protein
MNPAVPTRKRTKQRAAPGNRFPTPLKYSGNDLIVTLQLMDQSIIIESGD